MSIFIIKPQELAELSKSGQKIDLIDVRTPVEFREVHVEVARNFPLDQLDPAAVMQARNGLANEPLYVICRSGSRGQQACEKFLKAGFSNVINIEGGTLACVDAGLPIVRGQKAISLERQVRIAAGLLVVTGSALGYFVNPYWIGLAAFVGAGLTFAGITDTCAMGMMLARMPWNEVPKASTTGTDVRAATEFHEGHIPGAEHRFLGKLLREIKGIHKSQPIVAQCLGGGRSAIATSILQRAGFDVTNMQGGYKAWVEYRLPIAS